MIQNAKTLPQIYYGLHMAEGLARYQREKGPYTVYLNENTLKEMDNTFKGRPVFVRHVDEVDVNKLGKANPEDPNLEPEEVGYVIRSFFNQADGKHWAEFIVISDRGHSAIASGWRLSNAIDPKEHGAGGEWHGIRYDNEVNRAEYNHLAIVPNPRYDESIILTPDQFKEYNEKKIQELQRLANEKEKENSMSKLSFFERVMKKDSTDLEKLVVVLPKSGKEATITQLVNEADEKEMKSKEKQMANGDHYVNVGDEEMTVNALMEKHAAMCNELAELKKGKEALPNDDTPDDEEAKKKAMELAEHEEKEIMEKKKADAMKNAKEKDEAAKKAEAEAKAKREEHFKALKNASDLALAEKAQPKFDFSEDKVSRGKARYGSN